MRHDTVPRRMHRPEQVHHRNADGCQNRHQSHDRQQREDCPGSACRERVWGSIEHRLHQLSLGAEHRAGTLRRPFGIMPRVALPRRQVGQMFLQLDDIAADMTWRNTSAQELLTHILKRLRHDVLL